MKLAHRITTLLAAIASIAVLTQPIPAAAAPQFTIRQLEGPNMTTAQAFGINDRGDIVGYSDVSFPGSGASATLWTHPQQAQALEIDPEATTNIANDVNKQQTAVGYRFVSLGIQAYSWGGGTSMQLPSLHTTPEGQNDYADEINDAGTIVGYSVDDTGIARAVSWTNGSIHNLTPSPDTESAGAFGINEQGGITGNWNKQAVVWQNGTMAILPVPRPADIPADALIFIDGRSINAAGDVSGYIAWSSEQASTSGYRAFVWTAGTGTATILQSVYAGYPECIAYGINDNQEVVGTCLNAQTSESRAFYWKNGSMHDPGMPAGATTSAAEAINNKGEFVGRIIDQNGVAQAVRWR